MDAADERIGVLLDEASFRHADLLSLKGAEYLLNALLGLDGL